MEDLSCLKEETLKRLNECTGITDILYYQRLLRFIEDNIQSE
jgi:hypothetical protein